MKLKGPFSQSAEAYGPPINLTGGEGEGWLLVKESPIHTCPMSLLLGGQAYAAPERGLHTSALQAVNPLLGGQVCMATQAGAVKPALQAV